METKDTFYNDEGLNAVIKNELDKLIEGYRHTTYAYAIMNKKDPSQMQIINNNPEWYNIYLDRKYQFIDPVIIRALNCVEDFFWENREILSGGHNLTRIFSESAEHDIRHGRTFPLHDCQNNLVVLSIISHQAPGIDMNDSRERFMCFLIQLHQKTLNLYSHVSQQSHVILTPRELQVLKLAAAGKTYANVAVILSITVRTVKFHMCNVMKKLGVSNARHAIKLVTELRLLDN